MNTVDPLFALMTEMPPDIGKIRAWLDRNKPTDDEITQSVIKFIEDCCLWEEEQHSPYLYEIIKLMLDYGLKPDTEYEAGLSLISSLSFVDRKYVAADTTALLLDHGRKIYPEDEFFDHLDFSVVFDAIELRDRNRYDSLVHLWLVMIGYGATIKGKPPLDVQNEFVPGEENLGPFDLTKLRNHRNYYWGISHVPGNGENWSLHIFDRETGWEVARL